MPNCLHDALIDRSEASTNLSLNGLIISMLLAKLDIEAVPAFSKATRGRKPKRKSAKK